ncbi:glycine oxidase ThiO [Ramlibacter sp. AW1]|uniref:Glycine oxidase ThiO n=1 Tax=Ramlibacter aurantiacus TaxID=2801330 RepID=A0A936ZLH1_9BURK|nr:glycine oxidase ThiO [Ramlibacter aurantiacus]MBL0421997.1 glycine oxidase ThiO [Ramlibacter aurantiacus]
MTARSPQRVAIAGAGLLGRLLAAQLARAGCEVQVFDPAADPLARGAAGWTAAGMLSPVAELECADEHVFALGLRSLALWPGIVQALGRPVDLRFHGSLLLAHRGDEGAARRVVDLLAAKAPSGHAPQVLDGAGLRELEPEVQRLPNAWLLPGEGQIDTVQAMQALAETAAEAGARFHWGSTVVAAGAGHLQLEGGRRIEADHVFDVRGTGARPQLPVRGVRGEILHLHAPGLRLQRPLRLLHPRHRVYIVPRPGDRILVGASEIESEDRSPISVRSTVELLTAAHSVLPALAEARVVHTETNLRPALPDNLPSLHVEPGLTRINGLFRHGWLIGPALVEQALSSSMPTP